MNYKFPEIRHVDQVLDVIKGLPNFAVRRNEKSGFTTIDYTYATSETFARTQPNWEILRECRGIAFSNKTGEVSSRPFHKFFNFGEQPETELFSINRLKTNFTCEVKWDGSMVRPIALDYTFVNDNGDQFIDYVMATRAGITDHSINASKYVTEAINQFILYRLLVGQTPIFEFIGPDNINVLHYPKNELRLLAVRDNVTGEYVRRENILEMEYLPPMEFSVDFIQDTRKESGVEGYVLVTADGQHRMKVKTDDYCMMHRAKDQASTERAVLEVFFSGQWDDFFACLPEGYRKQFLSQYIERVQVGIDQAYAVIKFIASYSGPNKLNRKEFALHVNNDEYTKRASSILFKLYDKPDSNIYDLLMEYGRRNVTSSAKVENLRWLIGDANFKEEVKEDE